MNYREQMALREKEVKRIKFILFLILASFFLILSVVSFFIPTQSWQYYFALPNIDRRKEGELRIHYLDVGQADSTLVEFPDGKTLLIDAGDTHSDSAILRHINALKIKKLDYLLLTHTDSDHCGSAYEVLKYKGAHNVILPTVEENVSYKTSYTQFLDLLSEKGIEGKVAKRFDQITSSNESFSYAFTVLFPHGIEYEEGEFTNNELSTIGYLKYAETDALFCGDTTQEILSRLMKEDSLGAFAPKSIRLNDIELLKVPHHGADDGLNDIVLKYFNTKTSVISCGLDNLYGHPHKETLEFLANANSEVYRTDLQGSVVVTIQTDGSYTVETIKK